MWGESSDGASVSCQIMDVHVRTWHQVIIQIKHETIDLSELFFCFYLASERTCMQELGQQHQKLPRRYQLN